MTRDEVILMADASAFHTLVQEGELMRFAELVAKAERHKVAAWMIDRGYATGHGDTTEDLLKELEWQISEREREACAKLAENFAVDLEDVWVCEKLADAIRSRT